MPSGITHKLVFLFVHLGIILILVLGFYSSLFGRVRMVYLFSLCVVLPLSGRFTASALVGFSNFLKYLVFNFVLSLSTVSICRSSCILWLFYVPRCVQNGSEKLGLKALEAFNVEIGGCPP
jgi:hypothetical protein